MGHRHHEPAQGPPRRGASLSRRTFAVCSAVLAALWIAGAALLLQRTAARHAAHLDAALDDLQGRLRQTEAALQREAVQLAREPEVAAGARVGDWATLARGTPRARTAALRDVADLVAVVSAGGGVIAQAPETPPLTVPLRSTTSAPSARLVGLDGESFVLGIAPVAGDPAIGLVAVGRRAASLVESEDATLALFVVSGDRLAHATVPGAPPDGWEAALSRGGRAIDGTPWRLRPAGELGPDVVLAAVSEAQARAASRRLLVALGGALPALLGVGAAVAWVVAPKSRRVPARDRPNVPLETLYSAAVSLGSGGDVADAAARALGIVCAVLRLDVGLLYRADPEARRLTLLAAHGAPELQRLLQSRPLHGTRVGEAFRTGRHQVFDAQGDAADDAALRAALARANLTTALALPVLRDDAPWGVLALVCRARRRFQGADLVLLQAVAQQIGLAATRATLAGETRALAARAAAAADGARRLAEEQARRQELASRLERQAQRMAALAEVSALLAGTLDPDALADRIVASVCRLFGARSARLFRLDEATGDLVSVAAAGESTARDRLVLPCGVGAAGRAALTRRSVASPDVLADPFVTVTPALREWVERSGQRAALAVPLVVNDGVVGALAVADATGRAFDEEEVQVARAFADQAALVLANARLFAEVTRRRTEAEELARLARTLTESLDMTAVAERTVQSLLPLFGARSSVLRIIQPDGSLMALAVGGRLAAHLPAGHVQPAGVGALGRAAREGRAIVLPDVLAEGDPPLPEALRASMEAAGDTAILAVPLRGKTTIVGALGICDERGRAFTEDEIALLQAFADQATLVLDNARLYREAREYAERLRAVEQVNRLVSSSLNVDEVLANLARAIAHFFDAPYVSVWRLDEAAGRLRRALTHGDVGLAAELHADLAIGEGAIGWVVQHREPILWTDTRTDTRYFDAPALERRDLCWLTAYPIAIGDRLLGAFAVHRATPSAVTPETQSLMGSLAAQAAVALENARLYSETTDRLAQTRALLEVAEILSSTLDSNELLKRVAIKIAQVCAVDRCSIELWDEDRVVPLMSQFADGRRMPDMWRQFTAAGAGRVRDVPVNARVVETRRPVIVDDASTTTLIPREWVEQFGLKAFMTVPMVWQDRVIGVVTLDYCERAARFEPWQLALGPAVANQLTLSLQNTRLYAEAQERLRETSTLLAVGRVFAQPDTTQDAMRRVAAEVARAFGADMAGAYLLDERRERLLPVAGYHVPKELLESLMTRPIVLERFPWLLDAWNSGRAMWSADVHHDARFDAEWTGPLPPHSVLFVPTMSHGAPVGGLFLVWWRTGRVFTPAEVRLAEGVAAQVGLAMENAELTRQTQVKLAETETLLSASRALSSTLDVQGLVRHFLRTVARATGADSVGAWMVAEDGEWLEPLAGYRIPPAQLGAFRQFRVSILKHAFYADAARTRRPVYTSDARNDVRLPPAIREHGSHRTQLFVPVVAKDRMIAGFAVVWWEQAREFGESELALMEALANQAGVALENARLFEENRRRVEELSVLHDLSRAITGQLDRAALLAAVRAQLARVLPAENLVVLLRDDARGDLEVALRVVGGVDDAAPPRRLPAAGAGLVSVVLEQGRSLRTDDYAAACAEHGVAPVTTSAELRHWVGAPMTAGDRALGVLAVRGGGRPFTESEERLLTNIAHLTALALASARLYEERIRALGELGAAQDQLVRTEKLRALGEMASGVAHDFNNLLASILGRAQLMLRRVQDPQQRQWLQVIERSALDGAQTVKRLQDFTRIRRDEPLLPLDLGDVVRDALDITQSRWREEPISRGVSIEVRSELPPVPRILGDAAELREVFTNLILNAVDAMPEGGTLSLATAVEDGQVVATVADTGTGIPGDIRDKIFDPFFTTKGPQGTGLGLSMTYGIVARHGGTIAVDSVEGRGTTFRLVFPPAAEADPGLVARGASANGGTTRRLRCLVVDDEADVRAVLADILSAAGHTTVEVADGAAAIERFHAEPFDVVLTDLAMPRVSGWQVARAVKRVAPRVPVFLVTGFGVELSAEERRANGVDLVLVKPLQMQEVLDAVAEVARSRPPAGPLEER